MTAVKALTYSEGQDPKTVILDAVNGKQEQIEMLGGGITKVLVATAPSCSKSKGGVIFSDKRTDEARFQGKVGLILKIGFMAFESTDGYQYGGAVPAVGDWVFYKPSDGWEVAINGVPCRFIDDDCILGRISDIEAIY
jgi:co-chaperonin GroES (HSP10)